ncbi:MAG: ABC transporter permease [Lachnospiraceae bacterium]|nr:ABC transporter permease [Lachnospiraceae bacterium]
MINLANRNLKMYLRDRSGVFFSLLAILIIIGLYVLFLGDQMKSGFISEVPGGSLLIDIWVMSGIIAVTTFTTALGACSIIVEDRVKKNYKDFMSSPLRRWQIVGGYVLSACAVALMMCVAIFVVVIIYLTANEMPPLSLKSILKILGIMFLSALSSSSVVLFVTSFIKTNGAYGSVSALLGTLIGFLTGMYFPVGILADNIQWLIKLFPTSHACVLLRQIMMEGQMVLTFAGAPPEYQNDFEKVMGVVFTYGNYTGTPGFHIGVLVVTTLIFSVLAIINMSRKAKV